MATEVAQNAADSGAKPSKDESVLDLREIGSKFVAGYYDLLQRKAWTELSKLYHEPSCLSFEGQGYQGTLRIIAKFKNLPIQQIKYNTKTVDVQPSGCGGLMVFVTGHLMVDSESVPVQYSHSFHIVPVAGSTTRFWIHNDIFRLS